MVGESGIDLRPRGEESLGEMANLGLAAGEETAMAHFRRGLVSSLPDIDARRPGLTVTAPELMQVAPDELGRRLKRATLRCSILKESQPAINQVERVPAIELVGEEGEKLVLRVGLDGRRDLLEKEAEISRIRAALGVPIGESGLDLRLRSMGRQNSIAKLVGQSRSFACSQLMDKPELLQGGAHGFPGRCLLDLREGDSSTAFHGQEIGETLRKHPWARLVFAGSCQPGPDGVQEDRKELVSEA